MRKLNLTMRQKTFLVVGVVSAVFLFDLLSSYKVGTIHRVEEPKHTTNKAINDKLVGKSSQSSVTSAIAGESRDPAGSRSAIAKMRTELDEIRACYQKDDCDYSQADPRAYDLAVGQDLKNKLQELKQQVIEENLDDPLIEQIALQYLAVPDGHVKEAALDLLLTQDPSETGLEIVLDEVFGFYDSRLVAGGISYINNFSNLSPELELRISVVVRKAITQGSPNLAREITKNLLSLLNDSNYQQYQAMLAELSPRSREFRQVQAALSEFSRRRQGG